MLHGLKAVLESIRIFPDVIKGLWRLLKKVVPNMIYTFPTPSAVGSIVERV